MRRCTGRSGHKHAGYGTGEGIATFTGNGGRGSGAEGGLIDLFALPRSDQIMVIAKGGTNGGLGGNIVIEGDPVLEPGTVPRFRQWAARPYQCDEPCHHHRLAISNSSTNPIAGTFINLPDGSTFTAGRNKFQASYEGGASYDPTLTVVP